MNERMPTETRPETARAPVQRNDARAALAEADAALARDPGDDSRMLARLRALSALDDRSAAARQAAEIVATGTVRPAALDPILAAVLAIDDLRTARNAIALAEGSGRVPRAALSRARAQLAIASGDLQAATAILVAAIEEDPQNTTLRAQLTEALLAGGNAGHARDVLARIGMRPADPVEGRGGAEGG